MVTRITDAGILPAAPLRQSSTDRTSTAADSAAGAADTKSASEPAVKINLSLTASQPASSPTALSSEALVEEIRQRLANGQFEIDYEKVGEGMLRDLIAQSARKARS